MTVRESARRERGLREVTAAASHTGRGRHPAAQRINHAGGRGQEIVA